MVEAPVDPVAEIDRRSPVVPLWNWQDRILLGQADARADEIRAAVMAATPAMRYLETEPRTDEAQL